MALRPASGLNARRYILAALTAIIVVAALVIVFFVVMSPAHIDFSITHAEHRIITGAGGSVQLNFTIAANNTSRRAAVRYRSIFVDLTSNSRQSPNYARANLTTAMPLHQQTLHLPQRCLFLAASVLITSNMTSDFAVKIVATTRFRVGITWTRLYDIHVSCKHVDFFSANGWPPVHCQTLTIN